MSALMPALLIEGKPYYNYAHAALELKVVYAEVVERVASKDPQWKRWIKLTDEPIRRFDHIVRYKGKIYRTMKEVMDISGLQRHEVTSTTQRGHIERVNITQLEFDASTMYLIIFGKRYENLHEAVRALSSPFLFVRGLLYLRKSPVAHAMCRETNQEIFLTYDISRARFENPFKIASKVHA